MTERKWNRTETRIVRPFVEEKDLLSDCRLRVEIDEEFSAKMNFNLDDIDFDEFEPAVKYSIPIDRVDEATGLDANVISFIIVVNDPAIMRSEIVYEAPLNGDDEMIVPIPAEKLSLFSWNNRMVIDAALVLSQDLPHEFGKPFLKGHWIAKKTFKLSRIKEGVAFPIQPMDEDGFEARGLPRDTTYYVELLDLNVSKDELEDNLSVFINTNVLNALTRAESLPAGKLAIKMICADIYATLLSRGIFLCEGIEPGEDSVLKIIIDKYQEKTGLDKPIIEQYARESGYPKLKALSQSMEDLTKSFITCNFRGG